MLANNTSSNVNTTPSRMTISSAETVIQPHHVRSISTSPSTSSVSATTAQQFNLTQMDSLRFIVQVGFSLVLLCLCIGKLTLSSANDGDRALYWGGISSLVAWWMPAPGSSKNTSKSDEQ